MSSSADRRKTVSVNRKARRDYFIEDSLEAGIALTGTEIKSVRAGRVNLADSYVLLKDGEAWLLNTHIAPYRHASGSGHDPRRTRKLLLHRYQLDRLAGRVRQKGYTLVPLRMYLKNNRAKVEVALARGKKQYDKRRSLAERDAKREVERALARRRKGLDQ
ncbi:MAG: SsrA-binding protein SmpB [Anaerolineae bacterium]